MNAKKAKQLRREVRQHCATHGIPLETAYNVAPPIPAVVREVEQHGPPDDTGKYPAAIPIIRYKTGTITLAPCMRAAYQLTKRIHKRGAL